MSDHETECPFSAEELQRYEREVRRRIKECDGTAFLNKSEWHAAIIVREFLRSARDSVRILCGRLNKAVYGGLIREFNAAFARGVDVRVLTEYDDVSAVALAEELRAQNAFHSLGHGVDMFHFLVVDGVRYRAERAEADKSALVCACASSERERWRVAMMEDIFDDLWEQAGGEKK